MSVLSFTLWKIVGRESPYYLSNKMSGESGEGNTSNLSQMIQLYQAIDCGQMPVKTMAFQTSSYSNCTLNCCLNEFLKLCGYNIYAFWNNPILPHYSQDKINHIEIIDLTNQLIFV